MYKALYGTSFLHHFCLSLLLERGESNKTNELSYEASFLALLTSKTRLNSVCVGINVFMKPAELYHH